MLIADIIKTKGSTVVTIGPDDTVATLVTLLAEHRIGAVVVSGDGTSVAGIVSERDVVRHLPEHGGRLLEAEVSSIMTTRVETCRQSDAVEKMAEVMTSGRFRHLPVVDDEGSLVAIVSIGDVVKAHTDELRDEREKLIEYVQQ